MSGWDNVRMSSLKYTALRGIIWSFLDKVINQAASFVLLVYLSRVLLPEDFGLIAMLAIFLAIAQSLVDSGFSQALIQKSRKVTEEDLSTVFYVNLFISVLLYGMLFLSAPMIADFYSQPELVVLSRVLFIVVVINAVAVVPRSTLLIAIDFKTQSMINSISTLISAGVAFYMVVNDFGYWSLVGMNISKSLVNTIFLLVFSNWYPRWLFSVQSLQRLFKFGANLLVSGIVATIVQNLYTVLIGRYFNPTQVGYFQQGYNYTNLLSITLTSVIQGVTYPVMTSIQEDKDRLVKIYVKVMGVVSLITFPTFIGFAAIAEEFVFLFLGDKWQPIIPILIVLSFARLITPISSLNLNILNARGRSDLFLRTDLSKLPITIVALIIAVPYGILSVAIAQLCCVFISFFINAYYPGKLFGFGVKEQLKQIFPIAIASMTMFLSITFIELDDLGLQILIKIIVGVVAYIVCCWALKIPAFMDVLNMVSVRLKSKF